MIGSGFVAEFYMQGLANVNGHVVAACYSRDLSRAGAFAARWGIASFSADRESFLERDDIDLFVIALPNEAHLPVSLALSRLRRNQVCTKPLGRNREEARRMWEAAAASGALHGYAETEVFAPCVVKARETIAAGGIGFCGCVRGNRTAVRIRRISGMSARRAAGR